MTLEDLIEHARALARPAVHLVPHAEGAEVVARFDEDADDGDAPWIVVDLRAHPEPAERREALLAVHLDVGTGRGRARVLQGKRLRTGGDGAPLMAAPTTELPPLDALFAHGGPPVQDWLARHAWRSEWGYNDNFPDPAVARAYERAWAAAHPLYAAGAWAQLGGWPLTWPDEAYVKQRSSRLVVRTYRASEPWVEVLQSRRGELATRVRIT